jgi:hypothetical protein
VRHRLGLTVASLQCSASRVPASNLACSGQVDRGVRLQEETDPLVAALSGQSPTTKNRHCPSVEIPARQSR